MNTQTEVTPQDPLTLLFNHPNLAACFALLEALVVAFVWMWMIPSGGDGAIGVIRCLGLIVPGIANAMILASLGSWLATGKGGL